MTEERRDWSGYYTVYDVLDIGQGDMVGLEIRTRNRLGLKSQLSDPYFHVH